MTNHHHPEFQVPERDRPTRAQLRYLRDLAMRTGQSFATPKTKRQASREISRLTGGGSQRAGAQLSLPLSTTTDGSHMATAVREDEITGYGSTARWS